MKIFKRNFDVKFFLIPTIFTLFVFCSVVIVEGMVVKTEENFSGLGDSPRVNVTLSTGMFNQYGQCDGSTPYLCDMDESAKMSETTNNASSARISVRSNAVLELEFLKDNLNSILKTQLLKGHYMIQDNFVLESNKVKNALGLNSQNIELRKGNYLVIDQPGVFKIQIPLVNNQ